MLPANVAQNPGTFKIIKKNLTDLCEQKIEIYWSVGSMTMEAAHCVHVKLPTLQDLNFYVVYGVWDVNENLEDLYLHLTDDGPDEDEMTETQKFQHFENLVQVISKGISPLDALFPFSKLAKIKLKSYLRFKKNTVGTRKRFGRFERGYVFSHHARLVG